MSFLKKITGRPKTPKGKAPPLPEAIRKMKETEDVLLKKQVYLEERIKREVATAKKHAASNRKAALQAIQRKKRLERQLQQIDGALTTLESQRDVLEGANINTLAVSSMDKASKALKAVHKDIDVDKVDKILDDLAEQRELSDDISNAISQPVGFGEDGIDEEELERELEELAGDLEELEVDEALPEVPLDDVKSEQKRKGKEKKREAAAC